MEHCVVEEETREGGTTVEDVRPTTMAAVFFSFFEIGRAHV